MSCITIKRKFPYTKLKSFLHGRKNVSKGREILLSDNTAKFRRDISENFLKQLDVYWWVMIAIMFIMVLQRINMIAIYGFN